MEVSFFRGGGGGEGLNLNEMKFEFKFGGITIIHTGTLITV